MKHGMFWQKAVFDNERRLQLAGLLHGSPIPDKLVIMCHGFTGTKEGGGRAAAMADCFGQLGFATLLFDFSGCGESEGSFADISLTGHINDISCAVSFCEKMGYRKIITMGRSFGGTAVLCHAANDQRIAGVSAWAAPADPLELFTGFRDKTRESFNGLIPLTGQEGTVYVRQSFFDDISGYNVTAKAALISPRPLQLIHGKRDESVHPKNVQAIYNSAGEPKEYHLIDNADHRFTGCHQLVWDISGKWLEKHF